MAIREVWIGTYGPFLYNDEEPYAEEPGTTQKALRGADLDDLEDLEVESPLADHALVYDDADGKFKNKYITSSRIKDVPADRMLGRLSTAGSVQELTSTEVRGFLNTSPFNSTIFSAFVLTGVLDEENIDFQFDENTFSLMVVEKQG